MIKLYDYQEDLINRTREAFSTGYKSPCIVSPCGSGKSIMIAEISRKTTANKKRVLFLVHRKELIDQIKNTFKFVGVDTNYVQFAMVQTIVRNLDKTLTPDLIITDESHHGLAASYQKIYDYFGDVKRLGFTATPVRLNGDGLGGINDILIEGVSVEWLIENERLAPYDYYAPKLMQQENLKIGHLKEFTKQSIDKEMETHKAIYGDVIKHYLKLAEGEQAIAYCHSLDSSLKTAQAFNDAGITAKHIDAKTNKKERDDIIQAFRDKEIKVLCNVDLIGEGFDVPDCSTVIMLRPTKSLSLYIQQSMRGMRYKPNKRSIIIDHVANVNTFGLPDMSRQWTLSTKKKEKYDIETPVKTCVQCFGTYAGIDRKCPYCGHEQPIEVKETVYEEVDQDLEKVDKFEMKLNFKTAEECSSLKELQELGKEKNYKKGWAWVQAKRLGIR